MVAKITQKPERLISSHEVADRYGVCEKTVRTMARAGKIPKPKVFAAGRRLKWLESEIDLHLRGLQTR